MARSQTPPSPLGRAPGWKRIKGLELAPGWAGATPDRPSCPASQDSLLPGDPGWEPHLPDTPGETQGAPPSQLQQLPLPLGPPEGSAGRATVAAGSGPAWCGGVSRGYLNAGQTRPRPLGPPCRG